MRLISLFLLLFGVSYIAQAKKNGSHSAITTATALTLHDPNLLPTIISSRDETSVASMVFNASAVISKNPIPVPEEVGCMPRRPCHGPVATPDTVESLYSSLDFKDTAWHAPTPKGWTRVFVDRMTAVKLPHRYGLGHIELDSYDTNACAAYCDQWPVCKAFNIFFFRTPAFQITRDCPKAPSMTEISCTCWGDWLYWDDDTHRGHKDWDFDWVMAGSNGYNKLPSDEN